MRQVMLAAMDGADGVGCMAGKNPGLRQGLVAHPGARLKGFLNALDNRFQVLHGSGLGWVFRWMDRPEKVIGEGSLSWERELTKGLFIARQVFTQSAVKKLGADG